MQLRYSKVRDVKDPFRAHPEDAGIDFFIPNDWNNNNPYQLYPSERIKIPSGILVDVPKNHALIAFNKSGISINYGLDKLAEVVDSGYMGEIHFVIVNTSGKIVWIEAGMKILQFILMPIVSCNLEQVDQKDLFMDDSSRGSGGFGSTGI